jgi:hypothetical protein
MCWFLQVFAGIYEHVEYIFLEKTFGSSACLTALFTTKIYEIKEFVQPKINLNRELNLLLYKCVCPRNLRAIQKKLTATGVLF